MKVMMPVEVLSEACGQCPRLRVTVEVEHVKGWGDKVELECSNYEECLQAVAMYQNGLDRRRIDP